MLSFFDSHTHLQFSQYDKDRKEVFERAFANGIGMVNVGTKKETSINAVALAERYSSNFVYAAVGVHPTEFNDEFDYAFYASLAKKEKVIAIGECGLDYYRIATPKKNEDPFLEKNLASVVKEKQKNIFLQQVKLAKKTNLPIMIHCRPSAGSMDAYEDVLEILSEESAGLAGGIAHFFEGSEEIAKKFLNLGFYFTFGGTITFVRNHDEVIKKLPLEKILLETDAPFVTPVPHRGKRNEPAYIVETYKKMAEIKEIDVEKLKKRILKNNEKAFSIPLT